MPSLKKMSSTSRKGDVITTTYNGTKTRKGLGKRVITKSISGSTTTDLANKKFYGKVTKTRSVTNGRGMSKTKSKTISNPMKLARKGY